MQVLIVSVYRLMWLLLRVSVLYRLEMEYKVMENLGEGGFGVVFRVKNELDDTEYAVKIIELPKK